MSVVFFTDRDLGLQFPSILRDGGLIVERHADHFAHNSPDTEWLAAVVTHEPPMIAKVYRPSPSELGKNKQAPGRVELWYPKPRH